MTKVAVDASSLINRSLGRGESVGFIEDGPYLISLKARDDTVGRSHEQSHDVGINLGTHSEIRKGRECTW